MDNVVVPVMPTCQSSKELEKKQKKLEEKLKKRALRRAKVLAEMAKTTDRMTMAILLSQYSAALKMFNTSEAQQRGAFGISVMAKSVLDLMVACTSYGPLIASRRFRSYGIRLVSLTTDAVSCIREANYIAPDNVGMINHRLQLQVKAAALLSTVKDLFLAVNRELYGSAEMQCAAVMSDCFETLAQKIISWHASDRHRYLLKNETITHSAGSQEPIER